MPEDKEAIAESNVAESIQAASVAHEANLKARDSQLDSAISKGLTDFFNRGIDNGRFIPLKGKKLADAERFDFICDDIAGMHGDIAGIHTILKNIQNESVKREDFLLLQQRSDLTNKIVFAAVGIILLAFMGTLMTLAFKGGGQDSPPTSLQQARS